MNALTDSVTFYGRDDLRVVREIYTRVGHSLARRGALWLAAVFFLLLCAGRLEAQSGITNTLTSASANDLQNALDGGGNVVLNFNGTITMQNPIFISEDAILDAVTNSIILSGGGTTPIFVVGEGVTFEVRNLTISGGRNAGMNGTNGSTGLNGGSRGNNGTSGSSGTNVAGGAVYNQGTNVYFNCVFFTNTVAGGIGGNGGNGGGGTVQGGNGGNGGNGGMALGGAIYNLKTLVLSNCTFTGNGAIGGTAGAGGTNGSGGFASYTGAGGTGGLGEGAAVYNAANANLTVLACIFLDNFSEGGSSQAATTSPNNGSGQSGPAGATARGGGIFNAGSDIIINSTFFANLAVGGNGGNGGPAGSSGTAGAGGNGGGAYGGCLYNENTGFVAVTNCTFDGGQVFGGTNGLTGSGTFTNNVGKIGGIFGANIANNGGVFDLRNSILAYPTNGANAYPVTGSITDLGFNISSDSTPKFTATGSHNNLNPLLGVPANNGGSNETISIQGNSPARDAITEGSFPPLDQRGFPRPLGPHPDIGAFEFGTPQYFVSGNVGSATAGILVYAVGTNGTHSVLTDSAGNYTFANLASGTYIINPPPTNGFSFTPTNQTVTVPPSTNGVNFAATATFTIAGIISSATSTVTVNLYGTTNGDNTFVTQVNTVVSNGFYTFDSIPTGTYTIIPQGPTYAFVPPSIFLSVPPSNTNENFNAVPPTFTVSGVVSNVHSAITLVATLGTTTNQFTTTLSDSSGNYIFTLPAGAYGIVPQPTNGYTYTPGSLSVNVPPSTNGENFIATQAPTSSVSGQVANLHQSIAMKAMSSTSTNTIATDSSGNYSFAGLTAGTYTIAPQAAGMTISPSSLSVTVPPMAVSKNFAVVTGGQPMIGGMHVVGNQFSFTIFGVSNVYRIQVRTNLDSGDWKDISTNTAVNGAITVTNNTSGASELYYRAVTP